MLPSACIPATKRRGAGRRIALCSVLAVFGCAHASRPAPEAAPPLPPVSVSGLVINGITSKPLADARIRIDGAGETVSAQDGRFRLERVPVGIAMLHVSAPGFRDNYQNVRVLSPERNEAADQLSENNWFVLMFQPSPYFDAFPPVATAKMCKTEADCSPGQVCFKTNFREADMPACSMPQPCNTERDCKVGQRCEPVDLLSGTQLRICQGQPAPEVENTERTTDPVAAPASAPSTPPARP